MDQITQLQASDLEYNSSDDSYSDFDSNSSLGADLSPLPSPSLDLNSSPDLSLLEPSDSTTSLPNSKHTIGARIQAITYLELGLPHFQIIAKIGVSKA
jgi:hypothetical protein